MKNSKQKKYHSFLTILLSFQTVRKMRSRASSTLAVNCIHVPGAVQQTSSKRIHAGQKNMRNAMPSLAEPLLLS